MNPIHITEQPHEQVNGQVYDYLVESNQETIENRLIDGESFDDIVAAVTVLSVSRTQARGEEFVYEEDVEWALQTLRFKFPFPIPFLPPDRSKYLTQRARESLFDGLSEQDSDIPAAIPATLFEDDSPSLLNLLVPYSPPEYDDETTEPLLVTIDRLIESLGEEEALQYLDDLNPSTPLMQVC
ncbi:hypothetical protein [Natrinema salaciae]|nr:hypothetical protein [Natrinema salaciae]